MLFNLLASEASNSSSAAPAGNNWMSWVLIIGLVLVIVVFMVLNSRSSKKRQKETQAMLDAIQPGNKVKTIGGICGIVVEVNPEDNTFILETGTEASGKSYLKFDKQTRWRLKPKRRSFLPRNPKPTGKCLKKRRKNPTRRRLKRKSPTTKARNKRVFCKRF